MSEAWRVKRYYDPRVLVPVSMLASTEVPDTLVCLSGAQVGLVRTLLQYATRRITWVSEYHDDYYLAPTTEEWDDIQAFTADLEGRLMTDCVTPLVEAIDRVDATLATLVTAMGPIEGEISSVASNVGDLLAPLQCICSKDPNINITNVVSPDWPDYPEAPNNFQWGKQLPVATIPPLVDEEACKLAQCIWQAGFELVTEVFLPIFGAGYGDLLPAAAAALAAFTGGATLPVLIGVYALTDLLQELGEIAWEAAEANLINWMLAHKQDIVCELYFNIKDGGTGTSIWASVASEIVEPSGDLSAGDKVLVNFWFGIIGNYAARIAQTLDTAWYQSVPEAGYCDECEEPPIIGSDWVAVPYNGPHKEKVLYHPPGPSWVGACVPDDLPPGYTCVGMFIEVAGAYGNCDIKVVHGPNAGCDGPLSFIPDAFVPLSDNWYYYRDDFNHNHDECVAQVHPGAIQQPHWLNPSGDTTSFAWMMGWDCEGGFTGTLHYLVYAGTTPP